MPSFLESCENYYGTKDLYKLLQLNKSASGDEIKKAYRRLSLFVHPDRVSDEDKENATEKFKVLGKVYSILSDSEKRKIYDDTGCVDDDDCTLEDRDWYEYWRTLFNAVSFEDIANFEKTYKNSPEEVEDLVNAYNKGKGDMNYIFNYVPFSEPSEEDRLRDILQGLIDKGELKSYRAFTHEPPEAREARKRKVTFAWVRGHSGILENKMAERAANLWQSRCHSPSIQQWEKEAKAAAKAKKEISKKKSKKGESGDLGEMDLAAAIMRRNQERKADADSLFSYLEAKYCSPEGKKGKARKGK